MERPNIDKASSEVVGYIQWLEKQVNGSSRLLNMLNMTCDIWADDLFNIKEGKGTTYIGQASKDKKFEHVMTMIKEIASIKALGQATLVSDKTIAKTTNIADVIMKQ